MCNNIASLLEVIGDKDRIIRETNMRLHELVVLSNTLIRCYDNNPRSFCVARKELEDELAKHRNYDNDLPRNKGGCNNA